MRLKSYWISEEPDRFLNYPITSTDCFFKKGDYLNESDDVLNFIYIIQEGRVRLETYDEDGNFRIIYITGRGSLIGEEFLIDKGLGPYYFFARTDVKAKRVSVEDFEKSLRSDLEFSNNVFCSIARKNQILMNELCNMTFNETLVRVASTLLMLNQDFSIGTEEHRKIDMKFTHQDIADLIGVTRVSVANAFAALTKLGIIEKNRNELIIKNMERLYDLQAFKGHNASNIK